MLEIRLIAIGVVLAVLGALYWQWNHMKSQIAYFEAETTRLEASLENYKKGVEDAKADIDTLKKSRDQIDAANRNAMEQIAKIRNRLNLVVSQENAARDSVAVQNEMNVILDNALDCIEILSGRAPREGEDSCER